MILFVVSHLTRCESGNDSLKLRTKLDGHTSAWPVERQDRVYEAGDR